MLEDKIRGEIGARGTVQQLFLVVQQMGSQSVLVQALHKIQTTAANLPVLNQRTLEPKWKMLMEIPKRGCKRPCRTFGSVQHVHQDIWFTPKGP